MRNTTFCFVMAVVIGNTVATILLVPAVSSSAYEYVAAELFPDADLSTHVLLVHTKLLRDDAGHETPSIQGLRIQGGRHGFPRSQPGDTLSEDQYLIEVLDRARESIFRLKFRYPRVVTIPRLPEGTPSDGSPDVIYVEEPEVTLVLPYLADSSVLQIQSPRESVKTLMSIQDATVDAKLYDQTGLSSIAEQQQSKFHIMIMASGYESSGMSDFFYRSQEIEDYLLSIEPFSTFSDSIEVHAYDNLVPLGCYCGCEGIDRLMCCNANAVIAAAAGSGYGYDEIIVIHNTDTYCGGGGRDLGFFQAFSYTTMATLSVGPWSPGVAAHEFGHSFGNLCDEYLYPAGEFHLHVPCVNCRPTCVEFEGLTSQCEQGCGAKPYYFRPDDSIMLSSYAGRFNDVSIEKSLRPRLSYFTSGSCGFCGNLNITGKQDYFQLAVSGFVYLLPFAFVFFSRLRVRNQKESQQSKSQIWAR